MRNFTSIPGRKPLASILGAIDLNTQRLELAPREDRFESGLGQDAGHFFAFVALDFDLAVLHGSSGATGFLHFSGEFFFLGQSDADEILHYGHRFSATSGFLAEDVHSAAAFARGFGRGGFVGVALGKARAVQAFEWVVEVDREI